MDRSGAGSLRAYLSFFQRALTSHMAYVGALWLNLAALGIGFSFTILIWRYALQAAPENNQFFAYLALAFSLNFAFSISMERIVGERIREGLIATDMLKPVDMTNLFLAQALSDVVFQSFLSLGALGVAWIWLGPALLPASAQALGLAAVAVLLGFVVHFYVSFLFVQMIFLTHSNYGPFSTRMVLHNALSGLFAPLAVYPETLRQVAAWFPFQHIIHTPLVLYQGRLQGHEALMALGAQALWALGLYGVSRLSFNSIRRGLSIQGG